MYTTFCNTIMYVIMYMYMLAETKYNYSKKYMAVSTLKIEPEL